jgi:hypothetical protein
MTPEQKAMLEQLRSQGYAIVYYPPDELGDVNPESLEDCMIIAASVYMEEHCGVRSY